MASARFAGLSERSSVTPMTSVPLGVSGRFVAEPGAVCDPNSARWLQSEPERQDYIAERLRHAASNSIFVTGGEDIFARATATFGDTDIYREWAVKVLQTLRDHERHSAMVVSTGAVGCGINFVAWPGCRQEVFAARKGNYLSSLVPRTVQLRKINPEAAALLQIDAYVREDVDPDAPDASPDETFAVDVEFSYLPMPWLARQKPPPLPNVVLINRDLCSSEELAQLPFSAG